MQTCEILDFIGHSVYYSEKMIRNTPIGGEIMPDARDLVIADVKSPGISNNLLLSALEETDVMKTELAKRVGWTPQRLSNKLKRNSLSADEFIMLLDEIGVDVKLVVRDTGVVVKPTMKKVGVRINMVVDGVRYDTANSHAIANDFYSDGENEYTDGRARELYVNKKGEYFFAEYVEWDQNQNRIVPVPAAEAMKFAEKYCEKKEHFKNPI